MQSREQYYSEQIKLKRAVDSDARSVTTAKAGLVANGVFALTCAVGEGGLIGKTVAEGAGPIRILGMTVLAIATATFSKHAYDDVRLFGLHSQQLGASKEKQAQHDLIHPPTE